jgi:uncharacterized membrane protein
MNASVLFFMAFLSLMPISELRGAIPYGLAHGLPVIAVYPFCVVLNALIGPILYLFLSSLHVLLYRWTFYRRIFDGVIHRAREKVQQKVDKYGYLGIMLFVAVPLPITGAYTGTLGAWILGLNVRKTCIAVFMGVIISGIIVTLVSYFGIGALSVFVKGAAE